MRWLSKCAKCTYDATVHTIGCCGARAAGEVPPDAICDVCHAKQQVQQQAIRCGLSNDEDHALSQLGYLLRQIGAIAPSPLRCITDVLLDLAATPCPCGGLAFDRRSHRAECVRVRGEYPREPVHASEWCVSAAGNAREYRARPYRDAIVVLADAQWEAP